MTSPNKASRLVDLLTIVDSACFRNLPGARGHTGVGVWSDIRFQCSCIWLCCLLNSVFELLCLKETTDEQCCVVQIWPRKHFYETPGIV